jgi:hypothetical protein
LQEKRGHMCRGEPRFRAASGFDSRPSNTNLMEALATRRSLVPLFSSSEPAHWAARPLTVR